MNMKSVIYVLINDFYNINVVDLGSAIAGWAARWLGV